MGVYVRITITLAGQRLNSLILYDDIKRDIAANG